jgi:ketosteroid isomerase-like protein
MSVDTLIHFFETLSPGTVARIPDFYSDDARFKDPFNDVRGTSAIQRIFTHMFTQVSEPRFVVGERVVDAGGAVLVWDFHFGVRVWGSLRAQVIHGVSHLKFAADGKVTLHRDYWDTGEELYMKLPVLGLLMRALRRRLAA